MNNFTLVHKKKPIVNWKITYIFLSAISVYFFSGLHYTEFCKFLMLFLCLVGLLVDPIVPLCINIAVDPLGISFSTVISVLFWLVRIVPPFFAYVFDKKGQIKTKYVFFLLSTFLLFLISYILGMNSDLSTVVIQMFVLIVFLIVSQIHQKETLYMIYFSFILAGLLISFLVFCQLITGSAIKLWGYRLTYNGSVRTLSSALAIPLFYFFIQLIVPTNSKTNIGVNFLFICILLCISALLILTYSRGVIISVLVALLYIIITQLRKVNLKLILGLAFSILVVAIVLNNVEINDAMFEGLASGNGRTGLWNFFWVKMKEGGAVRCLFGFGPGDLTRIAENTNYGGFYAHSVLFDYLFSYGIVGFLLLLMMGLNIFLKLIKTKSTLLMALYMLTALLYLTHGNALNLHFHVLLGLCNSLALQNSKEILARNILGERE